MYIPPQNSCANVVTTVMQGAQDMHTVLTAPLPSELPGHRCACGRSVHAGPRHIKVDAKPSPGVKVACRVCSSL